MPIKQNRSYARHRYACQKATAKQRSIDFDLTYEEWDSWWLSHGVDRNIKRTMNSQTLCMCRYGDVGPYSLNNIYCASNSTNVKDMPVNPCQGRTSNLHPASKPCNTPLGQFNSQVDAAITHKVKPHTIHYRIKTNKPSYYFL